VLLTMAVHNASEAQTQKPLSEVCFVDPWVTNWELMYR
jgi:hypothetical protein